MDEGVGCLSPLYCQWMAHFARELEWKCTSVPQSVDMEKSIGAVETKEGYFQFSWPVDGNIRKGVLIRVYQRVTVENNSACEAEKMITHSLIAIKLLYIPPERLSLAAVHVEPFAFSRDQRLIPPASLIAETGASAWHFTVKNGMRRHNTPELSNQA